MKGVVLHGVLALVGLVAAYSTWTRPDDEGRPEGALEVFECSADNLSAVVLEQERKEIRAEARKGSGSRYFWFQVKDVPPAGQKPKANAKATEPQVFVGNEASKTFLQGLAPLRAMRSLGTVGKDTLKELELTDSKMTLRLECGSRKAAYKVGGSTFGAGDRYIQSVKGGPVYLLSAEIARDLQGASFRFMQRDLTDFELADVESLTVHDASGKSTRLLHRERRDPTKAEWVAAKNPKKRNELYGNWLTKVGQLRVEKYLKPKQKPGAELDQAGTPSPVMTLVYEPEGQARAKVELVRVEAGDTSHYYAKSDATQVWTKLVTSTANGVVEELAAVLGGKAPKSTKQPKAGKLPPNHPAPPANPPSARGPSSRGPSSQRSAVAKEVRATSANQKKAGVSSSAGAKGGSGAPLSQKRVAPPQPPQK